MCYRPANTVTIVKCLECGAFDKPTNETCSEVRRRPERVPQGRRRGRGSLPAGAPKEISLTPQGLDGAPKAPGRSLRPQKAPGAPKPPTP